MTRAIAIVIVIQIKIERRNLIEEIEAETEMIKRGMIREEADLDIEIILLVWNR